MKKDMCDSLHSARIRMGHKWLKWKEENLAWQSHKGEWNNANPESSLTGKGNDFT